MYVYVLEDKNANQYVGITLSINNRIKGHKSGDTTETSLMDLESLEIRHCWIAPSYSWASRLERYLHTVHKDVTSDIIIDCPFWCDTLKQAAATKDITHYEKFRDKNPYAINKKDQ